MKKAIRNVVVLEEKLVQKEVFVTSDNVEFVNEYDAIVHENLNDLEIIDLGEYFPYLNQSIKLVHFENEDQIEFYERRECGNKDDNTWGSWVSQKEKFEGLPKWIVCYYEWHGHYGGDYSAQYYTFEEFKNNLTGINKIIESISKTNSQ